MRKVGITGLPAAGKTTVANMFAELGAAVFDADAVVRAAYAAGGEAARTLLRRFPQLHDGRGGIDRAKLRAMLRAQPALLTQIEAIVHPLVAEQRRAFLRRAEAAGAPLAVMEIPLLFETGAEKELDTVIWVEAPEALRRRRLRARPGFDAALNAALEARLLPVEQKRHHAHVIIDTSGAPKDTRRQVRRLFHRLARTTRE